MKSPFNNLYFLLFSMKKFLLLVVIVLGITGFWIVGQYNSLVSGRAGVDAAWSNVEVQYQRRADIVPNSLPLSKVQQILKKEPSLMLSKLAQKQHRSKSIRQMLQALLNLLQHKENSVEHSLVSSSQSKPIQHSQQLKDSVISSLNSREQRIVSLSHVVTTMV